MKTLQKLFLESLADMYYAENKLTKALPKMAKAATHEELREAFESHLVETEGHVKKLEQVFDLFNQSPKSKKCHAILGLIKEAEEIISENKKEQTINAALILAAQKVEHYEIASYGVLAEWAKQLSNSDAGEILGEILSEEKGADEKLTELAEEKCNLTAQAGEIVETRSRSMQPAGYAE